MYNIGRFYYIKNDFGEALSWFTKALEIATKLGRSELRTKTLGKIEYVRSLQKFDITAFKKYERSLESVSRDFNIDIIDAKDMVINGSIKFGSVAPNGSIVFDHPHAYQEFPPPTYPPPSAPPSQPQLASTAPPLLSCPSCGTKNAINTHFCKKCGTELEE